MLTADQQPIQPDFYNQQTLFAARQLLGARLLRLLDGELLIGQITETEAYIGEDDKACHAKAGLTDRTKIMYGRAGMAYVYFTYGMHWMLNVVTEEAGFPAAVLIRAVKLENGFESIQSRRAGIKPGAWTNGPAKLTKALAIDGSFNGVDLTNKTNGLWIEPGIVISDANVTIGPRVGLYSVPEPWKSLPWRFLVTG